MPHGCNTSIIGCVHKRKLFTLYMPLRTPADYLLKHARESRRLGIKQVCAKTGIAVKAYTQMEMGTCMINQADAELLGALFKINPQYIEASNFQLTLLHAAGQLIQRKDKQIATLTKALKRKIKR